MGPLAAPGRLVAQLALLSLFSSGSCRAAGTVVSSAACPAAFDLRCCTPAIQATIRERYRVPQHPPEQYNATPSRVGKMRAQDKQTITFPPAHGFGIMSLEETFDFLRAGGSLARFGDGELFLLEKRGYVFENSSAEVREGLNFVAALGGAPHATGLCVGSVPVLDGNLTRFRHGSVRSYWINYFPQYMAKWLGTTTSMPAGFVVDGGPTNTNISHPRFPTGSYCNSFVSRPDGVDPTRYSALSFYTPHWQSVFTGKRVLLYHGPLEQHLGDKSVFDRHLKDAAVVVEGSFPITPTNMFASYRPLRDRVLLEHQAQRIDVVVLSIGATAAVLAAELACRGVVAIDVGQMGGKFETKMSKSMNA